MNDFPKPIDPLLALSMPPEPIPSAFGCSPFEPLDVHIGWPNLRHREPDEREVRELMRKLEQLAGGAWHALCAVSDEEEDEVGLVLVQRVVEGGTVKCRMPGDLIDAIGPAFERAREALEQGRWEAAVAHMRYVEILVRSAINWGHVDIRYDDTGETVVLDDHLDRYLAGNPSMPVLKEAN